jgi:hypothetical protein
VDDEVAGDGELGLPGGVVVGVAVPGVVETDLGTDLDGRSDPVAEHEGVLSLRKSERKERKSCAESCRLM